MLMLNIYFIEYLSKISMIVILDDINFNIFILIVFKNVIREGR